MLRPFLNTSSISQGKGGAKSIQSMPNLKEGLAAAWFWEIKFVINLISRVEPLHSG